MNKIEHIGIAVRSLAEAGPRFAALLGREPYKTEAVPTQGVTTQFFRTGESKVELLEASRDDSPIAKFLAQRGEGIHHLAFAVDDLRAE
ncbi:MAG: VOC family protein, partial [Catalinimonas sp.]